MRAYVASLSCLVQRYWSTATMVNRDAMPDRTAIQKTENFLACRLPVPLVLGVREDLIGLGTVTTNLFTF
jgi:hypothetical protein